GDFRVIETRLDDHFGGEFHSGAALVEAVVEIFAEGAQAAVDIVYGRAEPPAGEEGEHGVAPPAVEEGHCAGEDGSAACGEAAALHEVEAFAEFVDEFGYFQDIVAVVGVAHDDELASSGGVAAREGVACSFYFDVV